VERHLQTVWRSLLLLAGVGLAGCEPSHPTTLDSNAPEVFVSLPVTEVVREYEDFTGQTQAMHTIEVRARVSGYLSKVYFEEGAEVKQGALLFEIDPRPYQAELSRTKANVAQNEAHRKRLDYDYQRARRLVPSGSMGREDFDKVAGDFAEAEAAVRVAKAQQETAELNVGFTTVTAPIAGRISRRLIDPWNMVKADETPLTNIVSLDPIYAYFDVDEANALRLVRQGKIALLQKKTELSKNPNGFDVSLGLGDEEGFPHLGYVDFVDNQIDGNTGTLRMRGVFPNTDRLLSPGLFVRIRLPMAAPHPALLVSEQALGRDQAQKFVYVVNNEEKVEYRRLKVGRLYGGLREVTEGLSPKERVIVSGLQRVRPNQKVSATSQPVDMPTSVKSENRP
jgi:RND family efflux transporter MFP subunit